MVVATRGHTSALRRDPPRPSSLRVELWRRRIRFEPCAGTTILWIDVGARRVYVEERPFGPAGRPSWVVHVDGRLGRAPRQSVCATPEETVGRILAEVG